MWTMRNINVVDPHSNEINVQKPTKRGTPGETGAMFHPVSGTAQLQARPSPGQLEPEGSVGFVTTIGYTQTDTTSWR